MTLYIIDYIMSDTTSAIANFSDPEDNCFIKLALPLPSTDLHPAITVSTTGNSIDRAVHKTLAYISDTHMMHSTRSTANIINEIYSIRPDIVCIANIHKDFLNLPYLAHALIQLQIPTVITLSTDFPAIEKLPALVKRRRFNSALFRTVFNIWDNLFIVAPNQLVADMASSDVFSTHPVSIIEPSFSKQTAELYRTLFQNICN